MGPAVLKFLKRVEFHFQWISDIRPNNILMFVFSFLIVAETKMKRKDDQWN